MIMPGCSASCPHASLCPIIDSIPNVGPEKGALGLKLLCSVTKGCWPVQMSMLSLSDGRFPCRGLVINVAAFFSSTSNIPASQMKSPEKKKARKSTSQVIHVYVPFRMSGVVLEDS